MIFLAVLAVWLSAALFVAQVLCWAIARANRQAERRCPDGVAGCTGHAQPSWWQARKG